MSGAKVNIIETITNKMLAFYLPSSGASRYIKTEPITRTFDYLGKARRKGLKNKDLQDFISGSLYARLQRFIESGGDAVVRKYGDELRTAIEDFVRFMYESVYRDVCRENFAEARRFAKELRNACLFRIDTSLNQEWIKYKEAKK